MAIWIVEHLGQRSVWRRTPRELHSGPRRRELCRWDCGSRSKLTSAVRKDCALANLVVNGGESPLDFPRLLSCSPRFFSVSELATRRQQLKTESWLSGRWSSTLRQRGRTWWPCGMGFFVGVDLGCELEGGADVVEALEQNFLARRGNFKFEDQAVLVPLVLALFWGGADMGRRPAL